MIPVHIIIEICIWMTRERVLSGSLVSTLKQFCQHLALQEGELNSELSMENHGRRLMQFFCSGEKEKKKIR